VLRYAERLLSHDAALGMLARRRAKVYDALVPLTPGRLGPRRGDVLATVVDDVDSVLDRELRSRLPVRGLVLVAALATALSAVLDVWVGVVVAATCVVGGVAHVITRVGAARSERGSIDARARLSQRVVETTQVADELLMWQAGERAVAAVAEAGDELARRSVRSACWLGLGRLLALVGCGSGVAAVALLVAPTVAAGGLSAPLAALLILVPMALGEVIMPVVDAGTASARARAAEDRIDALLALPPMVAAPRSPVPASADTAVEVVDVTAGWDGHPALAGVSVSVPSGRRIGVVGPSGSGKSTLAALLLRFVDPMAGSVRLGGVDLPRLALDDVRRTVGLVDDDPHVFATTVVENVRLARPEASDDEVGAALREAGLELWLDGLADGLASRIGDGASAVSGGERARLAVARSLLADQRVLVLDEPTAHLDHATAEQLAAQVLAADGRRAVIWITHEPVGLDRVDKIVRLPGVGVDEIASREPGHAARHTP
jgi:ATP-binding cassette subfamily C protein CydCD